ncbi:MAG: hypothetical protein V3T83_22200 [Acidobacteriota bacterium]
MRSISYASSISLGGFEFNSDPAACNSPSLTGSSGATSRCADEGDELAVGGLGEPGGRRPRSISR